MTLEISGLGSGSSCGSGDILQQALLSTVYLLLLVCLPTFLYRSNTSCSLQAIVKFFVGFLGPFLDHG